MQRKPFRMTHYHTFFITATYRIILISHPIIECSMTQNELNQFYCVYCRKLRTAPWKNVPTKTVISYIRIIESPHFHLLKFLELSLSPT